jgi:hypothetical protein
VHDVFTRSKSLAFSQPAKQEVSRILSNALDAAHEVLRRVRRGELFCAQSLLEEMRLYMTQMDGWLQQREPIGPADWKMERHVNDTLRPAIERSYVTLNANALDRALIELSEALAEQIPLLHRIYVLDRPRANDLYALELVQAQQVA